MQHTEVGYTVDRGSKCSPKNGIQSTDATVDAVIGVTEINDTTMASECDKHQPEFQKTIGNQNQPMFKIQMNRH